jgi:hypothetical protein
MKKMTVLAAALLVLAPTLAFSDTLSLRFAYFMPAFQTDIQKYPDSLWAIELDQMSFQKNDFRGSMFGLSYEYFMTKQISLVLSVDTFKKDQFGSYLDYVMFSFEEGDFAFPFEYYDGSSITHAFGSSITPVQIGLKISPLGRKTRLIPYLGGGLGFTFWSVRLFGETIDFADDSWVYDDPDLGEVQIYPVDYSGARERDVQFSYHAFAGFEFPVGYRITFLAEARYHYAQAMLKSAFEGFDKFDLGGLAITAGFNFWF